MENTKWVLKERPIGLVKDSDFKLIKMNKPYPQLKIRLLNPSRLINHH